MLLFHGVCHSSKIYLLIDGLKLENEILKEVGSNENGTFIGETGASSASGHVRHVAIFSM